MRYASKAKVKECIEAVRECAKAEDAEKTRSAIEQIAQFFKKNQAYRVMVELMLPKRLHTAWKRVLNEFCQ